jgi:hypothetical protein
MFLAQELDNHRLRPTRNPPDCKNLLPDWHPDFAKDQIDLRHDHGGSLTVEPEVGRGGMADCGAEDGSFAACRCGAVGRIVTNPRKLVLCNPPQTQGKVQSAVRLALSGMYLLHASARIGLIDRQMTSNLPEAPILPIMAGLER